ncbi:hypothetical protein V6R21_00180 [Limibacter armeniacum]|uniref:DUF5018 domain-containing protein n=1 Tax=Limibacter armeniacum TaxID=466084 RepID=UPI002FE57523
MKKVFNYFVNLLLAMALIGGFTACDDKEETPDLSSEAMISSFDFASLDLPESAVSMDGNVITVTVPFGTDITKLTPSISISEGAVINPKIGEMDFSSDVSFIVTAEDGQTKATYTVKVIVAAPTDGSITEILVSEANEVTFDGNTIIIKVYEGTDVTALAPEIVLTDGSTVSPASGVAQDFTNAIEYTVSFGDETKVYTVKVEFVPYGFSTTSEVYNFSAATASIPFFFTADGERSIAATKDFIFVPSKANSKIYKISTAGGAAEFTENDTLSTTGVTGGVWKIAHVRTNGEAILASNMNWTGGEYKIYKWDDANDLEPSVLVSLPNVEARFENFEVFGDVNGDAMVYAMEFPGFNSVPNNITVYMWTITGGVASAQPEKVTLADIAKAGNYANACGLPDGNILVNGADITPTIYSTTGEQLAVMATDAIGKRTVGTTYFEFNGAKYLATMLCEDGGEKNQKLQIFDVTGASLIETFKTITAADTQVVGEGRLVYELLLGNELNGNVSGATTIVVEEDKVIVAGLATANGLAVVELMK